MALNTGERRFNWCVFLITYFISWGQNAFGYPASIISTTLGSPQFQEYMGLVGWVHNFALLQGYTYLPLKYITGPMDSQLGSRIQSQAQQMEFSRPELSSTPSSPAIFLRTLAEKTLSITTVSLAYLVELSSPGRRMPVRNHSLPKFLRTDKSKACSSLDDGSPV